MRKLLAALAASTILAPPVMAATTPVISVGPAQVTEGGRLYFPICAGSATPRTTYSQVYFETHSGTALPGKDYSYEKVKLTLKPSVQCIKGMVQSLDNVLVDGTRAMRGQITAVRYAAIGTGEATGTILDNDAAPAPAPVPAPVTQTCPDGSVIPADQQCPAPPPAPPAQPGPGQAIALEACPALNRPENLVAGRIYNVVESGTGPSGDFVVLTDAQHPGDGWFSLFAQRGCVQLG